MPKNFAPSPASTVASSVSSAVNPVSMYQYGTAHRSSARSVQFLSACV